MPPFLNFRLSLFDEKRRDKNFIIEMYGYVNQIDGLL